MVVVYCNVRSRLTWRTRKIWHMLGVELKELSDKLFSGEREKKESRKTGTSAVSTWMHWRGLFTLKDFQ